MEDSEKDLIPREQEEEERTENLTQKTQDSGLATFHPLMRPAFYLNSYFNSHINAKTWPEMNSVLSNGRQLSIQFTLISVPQDSRVALLH